MGKSKVVKDFNGLKEILQNQGHSCVVCVTVAVDWISKTPGTQRDTSGSRKKLFRPWERLSF